MDEKDKIIASLRSQLIETNSKIQALEQEVFVLKYKESTEDTVKERNPFYK